MWAWALFILGGAIVGKSTEHWQSAMPAGAGHSAATAAFDVLTGGAVLTGVLVLAGIGLALPSMLGWLRGGGWRHIRGPIVTAAWLSAAVVVATIGLVAWAHGLTAHARNGRDGAYRIAFLAWAALCAATLLAWTSAAARTARHLGLTAPDPALAGAACFRGRARDGRDRGRHAGLVGGRGRCRTGRAHRRT